MVRRSDMTEEERTALSTVKSKARIEEARQAMQSERDAHVATMRSESERAKSEVDLLLSELDPAEQRTVRMHAYLHVVNGEWSTPENRQADCDRIALNIARYMLLGDVR
jgi:hypothetical protein